MKTFEISRRAGSDFVECTHHRGVERARPIPCLLFADTPLLSGFTEEFPFKARSLHDEKAAVGYDSADRLRLTLYVIGDVFLHNTANSSRC